MKEARIELLQCMPIFGGVRTDVQQFLLTSCPVVAVSMNDFFFRVDDQGNSLFVLETGEAAIPKSWRGHNPPHSNP